MVFLVIGLIILFAFVCNTRSIRQCAATLSGRLLTFSSHFDLFCLLHCIQNAFQFFTLVSHGNGNKRNFTRRSDSSLYINASFFYNYTRSFIFVNFATLHLLISICWYFIGLNHIYFDCNEMDPHE